MDQRTAVILFTLMNVAVLAVVVLALQAATYIVSGSEPVIMVVLDKEPVSGDSRMLVRGYYPDSRTEILEFKDVYGMMRFDSAKSYSRISAGRQYQFTVSGFSVPQFGWYRTVMEVNRILV